MVYLKNKCILDIFLMEGLPANNFTWALYYPPRVEFSTFALHIIRIHTQQVVLHDWQ
jgi:hypothetical protein